MKGVGFSLGQYVEAGVCFSIRISKKQMESNKISYEEALEGLSKELSLNSYDIQEVESGYIFNLKDEVLEKGKLIEFLMEQYKLFNAHKDKSEQIINKLKELNNANDIIEFAEQKKYENFQYSSIYDNIYCGEWQHRLMVEYELIVFLVAGKIMMEGYKGFLRYIENLIRKDNSHEISEAVKVLIG